MKNSRDEYAIKTTAKSTNWFIYKNVLLTALAALMNFTCFSALQNLQSSLHPEIGFTTLCVLYAAFVLSLLFLPNLVIFKFGYKYPLAVSIFGYSTFALAQFYPKLWLMVIVAIICGCSSAVLWATTSSNLTTLAFMYAEENGVQAGPINQKFFAIFYAGFRSAQIIGNLISSLLLSKGTSQNASFNTNNSTTRPLLCGVKFCPGINDAKYLPESNATSSIITSLTGEVDSETIRNLILIYFSISMIGVLTVCFFMANICPLNNRNKGTKDIKRQVKAVSKLFLNRSIQKISSMSIGIGLVGAYIYGDVTQAFITCVLGIENLGYAMICFGSASLVASIIGQSIVRKVGSYKLTFFGFALLLGVLIWSLVWDVVSLPKYLVYVTVALFGVSEVSIASQVHGFYGICFPRRKEAAFSVHKLFQSIGNVMSFAYGNHLCIQSKIFVIVAFLCVGMCFYSHVYYKHQLKTQTREIIEEDIVELAELVEKKNDNTVCWDKSEEVQSN